MEAIMSSYSFSHQFYQHWTSAPQAVRAAIVQELTDITTLLQTNTPFEEFVFSNHDLDAHLDELYFTHDKQQAVAKELADKQAALRVEAEKQRLEEERLEEEKRQTERIKLEGKLLAEDANKPIGKDKISKEQIASEEDLAIISSQNVDNILEQTVADISAELDDSLTSKNAVAVNDNVAAITNAKDSINLSSKAMILSADNEQIVQELEVHIDDYLMEQMMQMSENLKSWLRAEVSRQLAEKK